MKDGDKEPGYAKLLTLPCRFCGQVKTVEVDDDTTPEEAMEKVALTCGCSGSEVYAQQKEQRKGTEDLIEDLFGESAGESAVHPETLEIMKDIASALYMEDIKSCTLAVNGIMTAKFSMTSKGKCKVSRIRKFESGGEA